MDIVFRLLAARQLHRQSGMLDAQGDPFSAQFFEAFVVPDLAANVTKPIRDEYTQSDFSYQAYSLTDSKGHSQSWDLCTVWSVTLVAFHPSRPVPP